MQIIFKGLKKNLHGFILKTNSFNCLHNHCISIPLEELWWNPMLHGNDRFCSSATPQFGHEGIQQTCSWLVNNKKKKSCLFRHIVYQFGQDIFIILSWLTWLKSKPPWLSPPPSMTSSFRAAVWTANPTASQLPLLHSLDHVTAIINGCRLSSIRHLTQRSSCQWACGLYDSGAGVVPVLGLTHPSLSLASGWWMGRWGAVWGKAQDLAPSLDPVSELPMPAEAHVQWSPWWSHQWCSLVSPLVFIRLIGFRPQWDPCWGLHKSSQWSTEWSSYWGLK